MSSYQHRRGQITDNALAALVHDPLFRQRVEKNRKGKGSYQRKAKHAQRLERQITGKGGGDSPACGRLFLNNQLSCYRLF